jgi:hypothetical protein
MVTLQSTYKAPAPYESAYFSPLQVHSSSCARQEAIELMTDLYTVRWLLHPQGQQQEDKLKFYLDSLVTTGELKKANHEYVVTGNALRTIEEYEDRSAGTPRTSKCSGACSGLP